MCAVQLSRNMTNILKLQKALQRIIFSLRNPGQIWTNIVRYTSLTGLEVQKCHEKAQTLPKDHLEHHLRPKWTNQIRIGSFLAGQTKFDVLWSSVVKMVTWKPFPIEEAQTAVRGTSPKSWLHYKSVVNRLVIHRTLNKYN